MSREVASNGFKRVLTGLDGLQSEMCKVQMLLFFLPQINENTKAASSLCNLCVHGCVWACSQRKGLCHWCPLRYPCSVWSLQRCLRPRWDSICAPGWLYSWHGVSSWIPWDPSTRPWLTPPLLLCAATLIHSKKLFPCTCSGQIASALLNKSTNCQISHKFKVESVARFCSVA